MLIVALKLEEFKLETYYSPSLKKTFIAPMPDEYKGSEFGPGVKALVLTLYRDAGMTERNDIFHQKKDDIVDAGSKAGLYQQA